MVGTRNNPDEMQDVPPIMAVNNPVIGKISVNGLSKLHEKQNGISKNQMKTIRQFTRAELATQPKPMKDKEKLSFMTPYQKHIQSPRLAARFSSHRSSVSVKRSTSHLNSANKFGYGSFDVRSSSKKIPIMAKHSHTEPLVEKSAQLKLVPLSAIAPIVSYPQKPHRKNVKFIND